MTGPYVDFDDHGPGKRRGRYDIIAEVLKRARDGKLKTHIIYKCNLNHAQTNQYLSLLLKRKLLKILRHDNPKKRKIYQTTPKGWEYLQFYNELMGLLKV